MAERGQCGPCPICGMPGKTAEIDEGQFCMHCKEHEKRIDQMTFIPGYSRDNASGHRHYTVCNSCVEDYLLSKTRDCLLGKYRF